ncbi:MAG: carboxypeptidase-like regulatory domain-containing protein [Planctomycetota bacterium]|jgi:hypothetical protein
MPSNFLIGIFVGVVIGGGLSLLFSQDPVAGPMASGMLEGEELDSGAIEPGAVSLPEDDARPVVDLSVPELEPGREVIAQQEEEQPAPSYTEVPDSWLSGVVLDQNGQPLADVVVRAQLEPPEGEERSVRGKDFAPFRAAGTTASNGRFILRGLLAGAKYKLGVRSQEPLRMNMSSTSANMHYEAVAPQDGLRLSLTESGLLLRFHLPSGMEELVNDNGEISLQVRFESERGGSSSSSGTFPMEFKVGLAEEEKTNLTIRGEGLRDVVFKDLVLEKNEGLRTIDVDFQAAVGESMVVMQIADDLGRPINVANIRSTQREHDRDLLAQSYMFFHRGPSRGDQGRFELDGLPLGDQILRVDPVEGSGLCPALVEVTVPEVGEVYRQVTLQRGGRLQLELARDHPGLHLAEVGLTVDGERRGSSHRLRSVGGGSSSRVRRLDAGGSYELSMPLPPGSYGLVLRPQSGENIEREFSISAEQVTRLEISKD